MTNKNKAVWDWIKTYNGVDKLFFHFGEIAIPTLKQYLHQQGIKVRF